MDKAGKNHFNILNDEEAANMFAEHTEKINQQQQRVHKTHPGMHAREAWERDITEVIKEKLRKGEANPHSSDWRLCHYVRILLSWRERVNHTLLMQLSLI